MREKQGMTHLSGLCALFLSRENKLRITPSGGPNPSLKLCSSQIYQKTEQFLELKRSIFWPVDCNSSSSRDNSFCAVPTAAIKHRTICLHLLSVQSPPSPTKKKKRKKKRKEKEKKLLLQLFKVGTNKPIICIPLLVATCVYRLPSVDCFLLLRLAFPMSSRRILIYFSVSP